MDYSEITHRLKTEKRFRPPPGWRWGSFVNADGARLRYGWALPESTIGVAVLLPGFCEFGEKYFEAIHDLLSRNLAVWQLDWRGQGGSERYFPGSQRPYAAGYERDVADLHRFVENFVACPPETPLILFGHSMGAHIGLRYLHDHPGTFRCAVLAAPMLELRTRPLPGWLAAGIARAAVLAGIGDRYVPGWGDWDPKTAEQPKGMSSDPLRDSVQGFWLLEHPELRLGGTTYRWLDEAFRSIALLKAEDYLRSIRTPVLMGSPKIEILVEPEAQLRAALLLPDCTLIEFPDSRHELWMERDEHRRRWLQAIDAFLAQQIRLPQIRLADGRQAPGQADSGLPDASHLESARNSEPVRDTSVPAR